MVNSVTRSYEYSALCDVCKFKFKASQLRLRWDGLMVCKEDWEPRHPSDFYRGRSDVHKLPFTRPDDGADPETSWIIHGNTTGVSTITNSLEQSIDTQDNFYRLAVLEGKTVGHGWIVQWFDAATGLIRIPYPASTSTSTGGTLTLPTTPTTGGTAVFRALGFDKLLGVATITGGSTSVTIPTWTKVPAHLLVNFTYGT